MKSQARKWFVALVSTLVLMSMVLTACTSATPAPTEQSAPTDAQAAVTEAQPAATEAAAGSEKVLRFIHGEFDMDWSPLRGGGWPMRYLSLWWAPPIWADMDGKLHPGVFSEWSSNEDYTVWTFKIDPKAKFSDGSPITADDVKGTWELDTQPDTANQRVALFLSGVDGYDTAKTGDRADLPGIVAKDASTVEVHLTSADPIFASRIASNLIAPVKISLAKGADGKEIPEWWSPKNNVAVSGPFMPVKMDLDKGEMEFVRNPYWWGETPKLDKLTFVTVEDMQTQTLMLQKGEAEVALFLDLPTTFDDLGSYFTGADAAATNTGQFFWFNSNVAPLDDINCRKALVMSVNIPEMFKTAMPHGPGEAGTTLLRKIVGDSVANAPFAYDVDAAKAAFAECKYKDAMPRIIVSGVSNPSTQAAAEYMVEQWRQVLGITEVELNEKFDELAKADQGKVQIFRDDTSARVLDPVVMLQSSIYSKSGTAQTKLGGFNDPEIDKLIDEAAIKPATDPERTKLALQAEKLFLDQYLYIPWFNDAPMIRALPIVKGYAKNLDWQIMEPWNLEVVK